MQSVNILQDLELRSFDRLLAQRPAESIDQRIVIIGETEPDIRRFGHPLSDQLWQMPYRKRKMLALVLLV